MRVLLTHIFFLYYYMQRKLVLDAEKIGFELCEEKES